MIPPIPTLQEYGLSSNFGFLPNVDPVARISSPYYEPWEKIADNLPELIRTKTVRGVIDALPMLDLYHLVGEGERRRAYVVLGFLTHAYVWAGDEPAECLPATISAPLLELSDHFEIPPVATYATVCLWNYHSLNPHQRKDHLSNLRTITTFTGTHDESWFYLISVAIEARGAASIPIMLRAIAAARENDADTVIRALAMFANHITDLGELLDRMDEGCHPNVFYFRIRPFLAGSKNMEDSGLPRGVSYEDRAGNRNWQKFSGGSNAQSSLIQTFDIILGVEHRQTGEKKNPSAEQLQGTAPPAQNNFIQNMRSYMPGSHRRFLEHLTTVANIKDYANAHADNLALTAAYNNALSALAHFRTIHVRMVTRYIILPSSAEKKRIAALAASSTGTNNNNKQRLPQGMALDEPRQGLAKDEASRKGLRGTGGTQLIPFLKQARDETTEPAIGEAPSLASPTAGGKRLQRVARTPTDFARSCNVNEFEDLNPGFVGLAGAWSAADDAGGLCHS